MRRLWTFALPRRLRTLCVPEGVVTQLERMNAARGDMNMPLQRQVYRAKLATAVRLPNDSTAWHA